jgi:hypothetical protein
VQVVTKFENEKQREIMRQARHNGIYVSGDSETTEHCYRLIELGFLRVIDRNWSRHTVTFELIEGNKQC